MLQEMNERTHCTREWVRMCLEVHGVGLVYAGISLRNPRESALHPVEVQALVDTGATHLCVPEHVALQFEAGNRLRTRSHDCGRLDKTVSLCGSDRGSLRRTRELYGSSCARRRSASRCRTDGRHGSDRQSIHSHCGRQSSESEHPFRDRQVTATPWWKAAAVLDQPIKSPR